MPPVYSTVKSTHLYSLAGNFLIWQVSTPLPASNKPSPGRPKVEAGPGLPLGNTVLGHVKALKPSIRPEHCKQVGLGTERLRPSTSPRCAATQD